MDPEFTCAWDASVLGADGGVAGVSANRAPGGGADAGSCVLAEAGSCVSAETGSCVLHERHPESTQHPPLISIAISSSRMSAFPAGFTSFMLLEAPGPIKPERNAIPPGRA